MKRQSPASASADRDVLHAYLRPALVIFAVALVAAGVAFGVASLQTHLYETSARVVYGPPVDAVNPEVQAYQQPGAVQAELGSVGPVIAEAQQKQYVEARLTKGHAPYSVTTTVVFNATGNSWAEVSATSSDPEVARNAANFSALSFLAYRTKTELVYTNDQLRAARRDLATSVYPKTSDDYVALQKNVLALEKVRDTLLKGQSSFRILELAPLPTKPYTPRPVRTALVTFAIALALGIGVLLLMDLRDFRLRTVGDVQRILEFPFLGVVDGDTAESVAKTVANLEFVLADRQIRVVLVVGSEATERAGELACDLAIALALSGKRVGLADAALRADVATSRLSIEADPGLTDVVVGRTLLSEATQVVDLDPWSAGEGLRPGSELSVLSAGGARRESALVLASRRFAEALAEFGEGKDVVLVLSDSDAGAGEIAEVAAAVDGVVCVVDMSAARRRSLAAAQSQLLGLGTPVVGVAVLTGRPVKVADPARRDPVASQATAEPAEEAEA